MFKKSSFSLFLLLFSFYGWADNILPQETFSEIKQSAGMKDGDIVYVDFWASWCNPCRKSFPWMNKMVDKYESQGFKILAINVDKDRALAEKFLASVDITFPIYYDPEGNFAKTFKLKGMPSSFILDSNGAVLQTHKGFFENQVDTYENEIQSLLKH
ncbi:TlpA disulfide reductase family protein [Gilvimarinus polysaccharolyticus]|uniref:TlpA disulfide reductase family protein n=1 Tax=Gilvimarinus polysaccharolyticus TaxID=863921 RepID=UPI000A029832|nr:TlpA disulfide reductase family protein [Gilvimarinus polysaccharolyticus]